MIFAALIFLVPFVVAQQDPSFVPSNQQPQVDVPAAAGGTSQVGGQINIQPSSGALPPIDPTNPQANQQQPPNAGPSQGQIPTSLFGNQGGQVNAGQPAQPPLAPTDPNNPAINPNQQQQPAGVGFNNQPQPNFETPAPVNESAQQPPATPFENVQPSSGNQGDASTQELFGTQAPLPESSSSSSMQPSNENMPEHNNNQEQMNQGTTAFSVDPVNSSVNAIISGLVLLFAGLIAVL